MNQTVRLNRQQNQTTGAARAQLEIEHANSLPQEVLKVPNA
jgi:hypothetical protein